MATTLLLIHLSRWIPPATDLATRMGAHAHPAHLLRSWVYFSHPFLVLVAALAVAVRATQRSPGAAIFGFVCFMLWASVEAAQQGLPHWWRSTACGGLPFSPPTQRGAMRSPPRWRRTMRSGTRSSSCW
ncbi:MAG: hypothetical protein ACREOF_22240 [Gemmatimonadales bacterium]